jgi:hypothetical protein
VRGLFARKLLGLKKWLDEPAALHQKMALLGDIDEMAWYRTELQCAIRL